MSNPNQPLLPPAGRTEIDAACARDSAKTFDAVSFRSGDYSEDIPAGSILYYWRLMKRRKLLLLGIATAGAAAGLLVAWGQQPVYRARATVEVQDVNGEFLNMKTVNPVEDSAAADAVTDLQTQLRILQSETLIDRTLKRLHIGSGGALNPRDGRLALWPHGSANESGEDLIAVAAKNLAVDIAGQTRILEVTFQSTDPRIAAGFANALTDEFIDQNSEARWQAGQKTSAWLNTQLDELRANLRRSDDALQAYARREGLIYEAGQETVSAVKLRQIQAEASAAQADRVQKESRFKIASTASPDTLADVLNDSGLRAVESTITDLQRQAAQMAITFKPGYSKIQQMRAEIVTLEAARDRQRADIVSRIDNDYQEAEHRESMLNSAYDDQVRQVMADSQKSIQYDILRHDVDTNRATYESMLQQVKQSSIAAALHPSNIRVIDPARVPRAPWKPNLPMNVGGGFLAAGMLGIVALISRARSDQSLHHPGEASRLLGIPELGVIPKAERKRKAGESGIISVLAKPDGLPAGKVEEVAGWQDERSELADSFRAVLTSILFSPRRQNALVITSAGPMEGKTTTAVNLAIALAKTGQRVLLIDGDMRKPSLHRIFGLENANGFSNLLGQNSPIAASEDAIRLSGVQNLDVLTSGPQLPTNCDLLFSAALCNVIGHYREKYDMVLLDTPPLLHMPDARLMGRLADGVILVARSGRTLREAVSTASARLAQDRTRLLGVVLNDWNPRSSHDSLYGNYKSTVLKRYRTPAA
ncbi:MAG TPA: polysaccharide biosynthesis tyrosine autokinase [Bryobacteraceae bacterium]|nr:polysaccharide biosynthesis tyrosine autokinase [Bryobacteraceae bacterium]